MKYDDIIPGPNFINQMCRPEDSDIFLTAKGVNMLDDLFSGWNVKAN